MSLTIKVHGFQALSLKFRRVRDRLPGRLQQTGKKVLERIFASVPNYPPPPIGSSYVRTFNLMDALTHMRGQHPMSLSEVRPLANGVEIIFGVSGYGPYVVGVGTQAWMHRGRWWTLLDVINRARRGIVDIFHEGKKQAFQDSGISISGR